jgi:hypothetical protein
MGRVMQAMSLPDVSEFYHWQSPRELWSLAMQTQASMSNEAFLSRGRDFEQKLQETLVASTFALGFIEPVAPVEIRMARVHEEMLDFELKSASGTSYEFEIVTAYPTGYKIREEYRDEKRPKLLDDWMEGISADPEFVAQRIRSKTEKAMRKRFNRHLLVYQNIPGRGATDIQQLVRLVSGAESVWQSIWLIMGIPDIGTTGIALLYPAPNFKFPAGEWLGYRELGLGI